MCPCECAGPVSRYLVQMVEMAARVGQNVRIVRSCPDRSSWPPTQRILTTVTGAGLSPELTSYKLCNRRRDPHSEQLTKENRSNVDCNVYLWCSFVYRYLQCVKILNWKEFSIYDRPKFTMICEIIIMFCLQKISISKFLIYKYQISIYISSTQFCVSVSLSYNSVGLSLYP